MQTQSETYPFGPNHRLRELEPSERLFRHKLRPEWGVGLWVREEPTRRRLRFDDGEIRAFKKGFYHLLVPVDSESIDVDQKFDDIGSEHELLVRERQETEARKQRPPVMTFSEQLRVFRHLFPDGFADKEFIDGHIRPIDSNTRRAHLGVAAEIAQSTLSKEAFSEKIGEGDYAGMFEAALDVLRKTSIVSPSKSIRPLEKLDDEAKQKFVLSLQDLLHGEGKYSERLDNWINTLTHDCGLEGVTWGLATVYPALLFPENHVAVKRNALELAARSVLPGVALRRRPTRRGYTKARRIARAVARELETNGLPAPDLLHVRVFIWQTLRPKAREILEELHLNTARRT